MTVKMTICIICKHMIGLNNDEKWCCKAFPNGIPATFLNAENNHDKPYPNDNGIQFEEVIEYKELTNIESLKRKIK